MDGVVLAFAFGTVRIGVAVGNTLTQGARPAAILDGTSGNVKWPAIAGLIEKWRPAVLVVGVPRHTDGKANDTTPKALRFARQLGGRTRLPVFVVDERYSSVVVEEGAQEPIDDESAAVILQQWFDEGMPRVRPENIS